MRLLLLLFFVAATNIFPAQAKVIYIDSTATGNHDGTNWTDAYITLSTALAEANVDTTSDSLFIATGTYYPTGIQTSTNRDLTFGVFRGGIKLYGGYPSGGGIRNLDSNISVLDGGIGTGSTSDNSYHVVSILNIAPDADSIILDGLTISGASADANTMHGIDGLLLKRSFGGGLVIASVFNNGKTTLRYCKIRDNRVQATYIPSPNNPTGGSTDEGAGAGIYVRNASPYIYSCSFTDNFAGDSQGGALFLSFDTTIVEHCLFKDNRARSSGVAVEYSLFSKACLSNCIFTGNKSHETPVIASVIGSTSNYDIAPVIKGCLIYSNDGTAIELLSCTILNCTITRNLIGYSGHTSPPRSGGVADITNSILSGNPYDNIEVTTNQLNVNYCVVGGGFSGNGNINANPMFQSPANANYRLQAVSPAINTGYNDVVTEAGIIADLDGNVRIVDTIVDMGAYEYPEAVAPPPPTGIDDVTNKNGILIYPNPASSILNIGNSIQIDAVVYGSDGKICLQKKHATFLDVKPLVPGIYQIRLYNADGELVKTDRFVKRD